MLASPEESRGTTLADVLTTAGPGRVHFRCDVTQKSDLQQPIDLTIAVNRRLDCLINNAGWHPPHRPIDAFSAVDLRALLELNLVSVVTASRLALPYLRQTRGSIINVASLLASTGQSQAMTYVATKGAIIALPKAPAIDEAPNGVRVNSVSPGNVLTPLWEEVTRASPQPEAMRQDCAAAQALGRMGTLGEIGRLCLFLAAEATFTEGVDHIISGGAELAYVGKNRA